MLQKTCIKRYLNITNVAIYNRMLHPTWAWSSRKSSLSLISSDWSWVSCWICPCLWLKNLTAATNSAGKHRSLCDKRNLNLARLQFCHLRGLTVSSIQMHLNSRGEKLLPPPLHHMVTYNQLLLQKRALQSRGTAWVHPKQESPG